MDNKVFCPTMTKELLRKPVDWRFYIYGKEKIFLQINDSRGNTKTIFKRSNMINVEKGEIFVDSLENHGENWVGTRNIPVRSSFQIVCSSVQLDLSGTVPCLQVARNIVVRLSSGTE